MKTTQQKRAVELVYFVKQRFVAQPCKFNEFAKILSDLNNCTSVSECDCLISKLKNMFVDDHQDLLFALNNFLPKKNMVVVEKKDDDDDDKEEYSWLLSDSGNDFFNKIRDRCIEKNDKSFSVLIKFCELIASCHDKRITVGEVDAEFSDLFKDDPDLYIECTQLLADMWEMSTEESGGLDHSGFGFLNKRRKVVRERTLFDKTMAVKEFYLHEMDLAFSRIQNTIVKLDQDPECFGECLSVHDKRCIVELYKGEDSDCTYNGEDLVEILQSDPVRRLQARDLVLERLRKKMMLLEEQKLRLDHAWREIFEDIREKGAVYCHREFLDQLTQVSKNNYSDSN